MGTDGSLTREQVLGWTRGTVCYTIPGDCLRGGILVHTRADRSAVASASADLPLSGVVSTASPRAPQCESRASDSPTSLLPSREKGRGRGGDGHDFHDLGCLDCHDRYRATSERCAHRHTNID